VSSSASLLDLHDALLLDLDGVVYAGEGAIAHAADVLAQVRARGVPMAFVTNNASRTPDAVAALLNAVGVAATPDEVATAAQAAARLLAADLPTGAPVLVVGGDGLIAALADAGLTAVRAADEEPVAVVQGYSPDVGWRQLAEAAVAVRAGARWVASNLDLTIPSDRGLLPGNGTLVAAVAAAVGRQPDDVAGKPARPLHDEAMLRTGGRAPLVVGDRLDTDIEGANAVGAASLLVLTGVTRPAELVAAPPKWRPTYLAADLRGLLAPPRSVSGRLGGEWHVDVAGCTVRLTGSGDAVDALCAVLAPSWQLVDSGVTPEVNVPAELAEWWG
jgi:HAD superfamily hydrolase (TIGR01450 family)